MSRTSRSRREWRRAAAPQWSAETLVFAPLDRVWAVIEDLSLIPEYHPEVGRVELVSGQTKRAPGVEYRCIIPEGRRKGWCVERVEENVPGRRMTVSFPSDSWGMGRLFDDFRVSLTLEPRGEVRTAVRLEARYVPRRLWTRALNALVLRRMMRDGARRTLEGMKRWIEARESGSPNETRLSGRSSQTLPGGIGWRVKEER